MPGSPVYHTIDYSFQPGESVWVIYNCGGTPKVEGATVIRVRGEVLVTTSSLYYDVQLDSASAGTMAVVDANIFGSLAQAIAEYQVRLAAL